MADEFLSIEMEQRKKKEEEERLIEERRRAARRLHRDQQDIIQQQKTDSRRRTIETTNGFAERRRTGAMSGIAKPELPPRPATLERKPIHSARKPRSSSFQGTGAEGGMFRSRQEEDMKTREALMQQSRREAQLSRQRLEEERLKSKQKKDSPLSRESLTPKSKDSDLHVRSPELEAWEESIFHNIHKRTNMGNVRSLPATLKNKEDPNFTIKRMYDNVREEFEKLEILREALESRLRVTLPDDLPASLADGVVLCHLINLVCKGTIPSIHIPSAGVPKLTMTKCQKNVDSFLEACRKLGVMREDLCSAADILQEKSPQRVCITVQALLRKAENS